MSAINVNSITGRTGSHGPVLTGVTTATNGLDVSGGVTVGTGATIDGSTNTITVSTNASERLRIDSLGRVEMFKPGSADQANLILNSGGVGDPSSEDPRIQFGAGGLESKNTTEIRSTGAYNARALAFYTGTDANGSERMRIDSSGRLLVGTTATGNMNGGTIVAGDQLGTFGSVALAIKYTSTDTVNTFGSAYSSANTVIGFGVRSDTTTFDKFLSTAGNASFERGALQVGGELIYSNAAAQNTAVGSEVTLTERMRIDNSGRLLVGTSSAAGSLTNQIALHGAGAVATDQPGIFIAAFPGTNDTYNGYLEFYRSASSTLNTNTLVGSDDRLGMIRWSGANGSGYDPAAAIYAEVDGTPGASNDMPGRLILATTADGASVPTQRMRITNGGAVIFGTGLGGQTGLTIYPPGTTSRLYFNRAATGSTSTALEFADGGVTKGSINYTNTATAYNTSSDYRLKENVVNITDGITRLQQLKPSRFNFIVEPDTTVDGFLAHEAQAVVPECATGEKDAVDENGDPIYQGIDQSKLVPLLTAALQEAITKIETLEAKVATLEGN